MPESSVLFVNDVARILQGFRMARPEWAECLEAVAHAVGCELYHAEPVRVVRAEPYVTGFRPAGTVFFEPTLTCGHPKSSLRYEKGEQGWVTSWCIDCEAEHATDSGGNGG